ARASDRGPPVPHSTKSTHSHPGIGSHRAVEHRSPEALEDVGPRTEAGMNQPHEYVARTQRCGRGPGERAVALAMRRSRETMRIAVLSDIHANSDALVAVLADVRRQGVGRVMHLGDLVGYNTRPRETLALVRERDIPGVQGNHDLMALGRLPPSHCGPIGRKAIAWTHQALTDADR